MSAPMLKAGAPGAEPDYINFWVETGTNCIYLKARHSRDSVSQNVAIIQLREDGVWGVSSRNLFSHNLCAAFGISRAGALPIATESEYCESTLAASEAEGRA